VVCHGIFKATGLVVTVTPVKKGNATGPIVTVTVASIQARTVFAEHKARVFIKKH
jgi:hypothetical protein